MKLRCVVSNETKGQRVIAVRDSKDPEGPKLFFSVAEWRKFLDAIKAGDYDLPEDMREGLDERFAR